MVFVHRFPGWPWDPCQTKHEWMIVAMRMSLSFFLWEAARRPLIRTRHFVLRLFDKLLING
jgi:hypothetical protein